ncbi:hypothetical protein DQ04_03771030 [Trypanosoma grayi]|uniref:hypothetical protein n=1 Tax=Trypanosoma grayi TaxID=71804 RepID=UPI0004F49EC7|nr:hypothetical protein DQ04_03771030 [Trypanosoma grayi]KEG10387.1 hypothetical protein DQ04_03771030 [Trypanosoma grayi]
MPAAAADVTARKVRASRRRRRRWVRRTVWAIMWWAGAVTLGKAHLDSVRMYIIVSVLLGIFLSLRRVRQTSAEDEDSDETPLSASVDNTTHSARGGSAVAATAPYCSAASIQRQCAAFAVLKAIGTSQAVRAIRDEDLRDRILNSPPDAVVCCCGSGKRFSRCCLVLQEELRRCGL